MHREQARFELNMAAEGTQFLEDAASIRNEANYDSWKRSRSRWTARIPDAHQHIYNGAAAAQEFGWSVHSMIGYRTWQQNLDRDYKGIQDGINTLLSLAERLKYDAEPDQYGEKARLPRVARLKVSRAEAESILGKHLKEGEALRSEAANDNTVLILEEEQYKRWRQDQKRWNGRTRAALRHIYEDNDASDEFMVPLNPRATWWLFGVGAELESDYEDAGKTVARWIEKRVQMILRW